MTALVNLFQKIFQPVSITQDRFDPCGFACNLSDSGYHVENVADMMKLDMAVGTDGILSCWDPSNRGYLLDRKSVV